MDKAKLAVYLDNGEKNEITKDGYMAYTRKLSGSDFCQQA